MLKPRPPADKSSSRSYRAKLPVLPVSASQLLALDKNGTDYYEEVLELASKDPVIAAQIIKLSNSAALGGSTEIETLHQAVASYRCRSSVVFDYPDLALQDFYAQHAISPKPLDPCITGRCRIKKVGSPE